MHTVIITGSSSGFGFLTTVELARKGYHVIATMRNMKKATIFSDYIDDEETLNRIHPFYLDVTSETSIEEFKHYLLQREPVDVLINNAGYALGGFAEEIKMDEYRKQFDTNVFGVMAVTQAVLPVMRKYRNGKIINMSSISGLVGFPGLSAYVSAKHALEGYTESLRLEVKPFGIDVALIEPGSYQTNIWSSGMVVSECSQSPSSPYHLQMKNLLSLIQGGEKDRGNPEEVARLIGRLITQKQIKRLRHPVGTGVSGMTKLKRLLPWHIWEKQILKRTLSVHKRGDSKQK